MKHMVDSNALFNLIDRIREDGIVEWIEGSIDYDLLIWSVAARINGKNYIWCFDQTVPVSYDLVLSQIRNVSD